MPITRIWRFPTDGYTQTVKLKKSNFGSFMVLGINELPPALLRKQPFKDVFEHAFQIGTSQCILRVNFGKFVWPSYDFFVNGRSIQTQQVYTPPKDQSALRLILGAIIGFLLGFFFGLLALALFIPLFIYCCVTYKRQKLVEIVVDAIDPPHVVTSEGIAVGLQPAPVATMPVASPAGGRSAHDGESSDNVPLLTTERREGQQYSSASQPYQTSSV
mmetsp:Transcript_14764/g.37672  ORF Transcript_14764/g.37672 Transcript_14764/m.37672 type:complete len:216 (-) Transcript_14764:290-937(-)